MKYKKKLTKKEKKDIKTFNKRVKEDQKYINWNRKMRIRYVRFLSFEGNIARDFCNELTDLIIKYEQKKKRNENEKGL